MTEEKSKKSSEPAGANGKETIEGIDKLKLSKCNIVLELALKLRGMFEIRSGKVI